MIAYSLRSIQEAQFEAKLTEVKFPSESSSAKPSAGKQDEETTVRSRRKGSSKKRMTDAQVMRELKNIISPGPPEKKYTKGKKIGAGASGQVYLANSRLNQQEVAIKMMDLSQQPKKELIITEIQVREIH